MISLWKVSFLFFCSISSHFGPVNCVTYVENGKSLTINPNIKGTPEDILWTFNGNKVAERDLKEFQDYGQFKKRTDIEISTGQLTVQQMTSIDSGVYTFEIQINGMLQTSRFEVQVIDAVPEPDVTCKLNSTMQSRVLFCSVAIPKATFKWTGPNVSQHSEQTLYIGKDEQPESVYTCTVENPVSQKTNSITLQDCITDGSNLLLKIILPIICVIIFVFGVAIYICRRKNKGKKISSTFKEEEGTGLLENSKGSPNGDQSVDNNKEADSRNQEMVSAENANCADGKILGINEIQDLPEQMHESAKESSMKEDKEKNEEQEMNNDKGVSVDRDEKTVQMNKDTESKKISDDDNIQQELNKTDSQDQSEKTHESAEDVNKHVIDGHDAVENREQDKSEAGDQSVDNEKEADSRNQEMESDENAKGAAEKISSTNEIQGPPEQMHESAKNTAESSMKEDNEEKNEEEMSKMRKDRGVRDEQTAQMKEDTEAENCSDDNSMRQELNKTNSQDQSEKTHESATVSVKEIAKKFEE